jgi:phage gp36-like protein
MLNLLDMDYIRGKMTEDDINALTDNQYAPDKLQTYMNESGAYIETMLSDVYNLSGINEYDKNLASIILLQRIQFEIFKHFLYQSKYDDEQKEAVKQSYNEHMAQLERIRNGQIPLKGIPKQKRNTVYVKSPERIFTQSTLKRYDS